MKEQLITLVQKTNERTINNLIESLETNKDKSRMTKIIRDHLYYLIEIDEFHLFDVLVLDYRTYTKNTHRYLSDEQREQTIKYLKELEKIIKQFDYKDLSKYNLTPKEKKQIIYRLLKIKRNDLVPEFNKIVLHHTTWQISGYGLTNIYIFAALEHDEFWNRLKQFWEEVYKDIPYEEETLRTIFYYEQHPVMVVTLE